MRHFLLVATVACGVCFPGSAGEPPSSLASSDSTVVPRSDASADPSARVLIVTGIDYPGHPWKRTAPFLTKMLEEDPRLTVRVVEDPHFLDSTAIDRFDVIVLHFMDWEVASPGPRARANLRSFVERGGGLMLVHFACGAWQDWPGFVELAGRVWDPKLRGHDPRGRFEVEIVDSAHPITRGLSSFETDDELYTCLAGDVPIKVLAVSRSKVDGTGYPMAFVLTHGAGRVFHTPLGHDVKALTAVGVGDLFRRGCAWAGGLSPDP